MPYRTLEDPAKLRRLLQAILLLQADFSLPVLLRHFVEEARALTGATYAALGVLDQERQELSELISVGMPPEVERAIAHRPTGKGLLGLLIADPRPVRLADISTHPEHAGFPPGHPEMRSFLGVPVAAHDEVFGNLYLADKVGRREFTRDDETLAASFARAAAIAIDNARLHQRVRKLAVLEDRDRIARDLHDSVIQRLFAVGLSLQGMARPPLPAQSIVRLQRAIGDLDETIRRIRTSIFELESEPDEQGLRARVLETVRELHPLVGLDVPVTFEGAVDATIDDVVADQLLLAVREALTSVARHAQPGRAAVTVRVAEGTCTLEVADEHDADAKRPARAAPRPEGAGGTADHPAGDAADDALEGFGLLSMRRRAEKLGGELIVESPSEGGTTLVWRVPVGVA